MGILSTVEIVLVDILPLELLRRLTLSRALHECEESESSVGCEKSGDVESLGEFWRLLEVGYGEEMLRDFEVSSVLNEAVEASDNGCRAVSNLSLSLSRRLLRLADFGGGLGGLFSSVPSTRSALQILVTKATVSGLTGEGGETGRNGELAALEILVIVLEEVVDIGGLAIFGRRESPEAFSPLGDGGG